MVNSGFWLNKNGVLFDVSYSSHIEFIMKNPEIFDLTNSEIDQIYEKYGERKGLEGNQREEIIKSVYSQGWIRIRFYNRRGWILQTDSIKERQGLIKSFLMQQSGEGIKLIKNGNESFKKIMSPYENVYIQDLESNQKHGEVTKVYRSIYESKKNLKYTFYLFESVEDLKEQVLYESRQNLKKILDKSNNSIIEQIQLSKIF